MKNTLHKRYDINNSKVVPASSGVFQSEQRLQSNNIYPRKNESSGSEKDQLQRMMNKNMKDKGQSMKNSDSVAYSKHMTTAEQKRKILQKYKYINQLARLQYEDKLQEVYTKYTKLSKATATKKILAKNRIAQFIDQQQDQNIGYDELLEFQFGKNKGQSFHFEKQEILQYDFCQLCDTIHNDHPEAHLVICQKRRRQQPELYSPYSQRYMKESLIRIKLASQRIKSREFQQIFKLLSQLQKCVNQSSSIITKEKRKLVQSFNQLSQNINNQDIFSKVIKKVCRLIQKL